MPARQREWRAFNAGMRCWCRQDRVQIWETFWDKPSLYKRDGLHLNDEGSLLVHKVKKVAKQLLN